jgi:hypothetical protein
MQKLTNRRALSGLGAVAAVTTIAVAGSASAAVTTIYDSQGFEAPTFVPGNLVGQDGWQKFALDSGASTADVVTLLPDNQVQSGLQSVNIERPSTETQFGSTGFFVDVTAAAANHQPVVYVQWDMYVPTAEDQDPDPIAESFGPGFSLEVYSTGITRLLNVGVDSATGEFYEIIVDDPATPDFTNNPAIQLDQWQSWEVVLDFTNEVYFTIVDGVTLDNGGAQFLNDIDYAGGDRLNDAPIITYPTDQSYVSVSGEAWIDNYRILDGTVVPEPSVAVLGLAGLVGLRRRR